MTVLRRFVAVANGRYVNERPLTRAVPDSAELAEVLRDRHGYDTLVLADLPRGDLLDRIDGELAEGALTDGVLILMWTGHGRPGPDELHLLGTTARGDAKVATPAELAEWSARTGARQVFVLLDVCYSGTGVPDAIGRAHAVFSQRAVTGNDWFGIFAACRPDEPALSGALAGEVGRLLQHGPSTEALRRAWLFAGAEINADALFTALATEWSQPRQTPQPAQLGTAGPLLRNPLLAGAWLEGVVEHLLTAARGTSTAANYFVGREKELHTVVAWLRHREPGLMLITGPPGCGKSALLGRVVSLSDPTERTAITARGPVPDDLDPGQSAFDAHLHARRLRVEQAVEQLCLRLGLPAGGSIYDLLGATRQRRIAGRPVVLAVDGLDEAGPLDAPKIATELLVPLAREARVLVAARPRLGTDETEALLSEPGRAVDLLDLGADPEATLRDVEIYAQGRLAGVSPSMQPDLVAQEIAELAESAEARLDGSFLLARLLTSQLRADPVDTSEPGWRDSLARSVGAALEHDLDNTVLEVDGRARPTAARELLTALAYACGEGFPADDDVWPTVATTLSPTGARYVRDDVAALLDTFGRHIVVGRERDRAVFRIAHQRLVEYLLPVAGPDGAEGGSNATAAVATAVHRAYCDRLDAGERPQDHAYLWRYAWRHFADAGRPGLDLLRNLVERDRAAFLPDLAMALDRVADHAVADGDAEGAVEHQTEAVEIERELNPDGSAELALALFDLAMALSLAGRSTEANETADEAAAMAWRFADEPSGVLVVSGALLARAMARRSMGDPEAVVRYAREAAALIGTDDPALRGGRASAGNLVAESLMALGRLDEAAEAAADAVRDAEAAADTDERELDVGLLFSLSVQVMIQLAVFGARSAAQPDGTDPGPRVPAAARLLALVETAQPKGGLQELGVADALRLVAGSYLVAGDRSGLTDEQHARRCLDRALALATPYAAQSMMGAVVFAQTVWLKVAVDPGSMDMAAAETALRPFADHDSRAAAQLAMIAWRRATDMSLPSADRLDAAIEAVDLLGAGRLQPLEGMRLQALLLIWTLAVHDGDRTMALAALEQATTLLDEAVQPLPGADKLHAILLSERAALLVESRTGEAVALGTRAVALLRALPPDPEVLLSTAQTELNLGVIAAARGRPDEAAATWARAVAGLAGNDRPEARILRGQALGNIVAGRLVAGTVDEATVADAREALALLDGVTGGVNPNVRPLAVLLLARVLHAVHDPGAEQAARQAAAAIVERVDRGNADTVLFSLADIPDDEPIWAALRACTEAVARWPIPFDLLGAPAPERLPTRLNALMTAIAQVADDHELRNSLRQLVRMRRRGDPERFDAVWAAHRPDEPPDWLAIDDARTDVVVAWWNTNTWRESRAFLAAHPELLEPSTEVYLTEIADDSPDLLAVHRDLVEAARGGTADAEFDRLEAGELATDWAHADDLIGFLEDHGDDVPAAALMEVLKEREMVVEESVLTLFNTGERALAHRIGNGQVPWEELLRAGWRSDDPVRLRALATLCGWSERSGDDRIAFGVIARAVASARLGEVDDAVTMLHDVREETEEYVPRWRDVVADAIAYETGDGAAALARLLAALR